MHCLVPRFRIRRSVESIFRVEVHSGKKVAPLHGVPSCFHETRAVWCLCGWQDMRAMHDLGVSDGKGNPSWQDYRSVYSQMAVCRAYWIHGVQILPKPAHFGYTAAICCQRGVFFLSEARFGIHQVKILPRMSAWESFRWISCHRRSFRNMPWQDNVAAIPSRGSELQLEAVSFSR